MYALNRGLCGMDGVAMGKRGDGFGELNGEWVEDLVRAKPGGAIGAALEGRGEPVLDEGVTALWTHDAGDLERMTVAFRAGGGVLFFSVAAFHCQRDPRTASSSALPFSNAGALLSSSSSRSVFSSSPNASSSSTGLQIS